MTKFSKLYKKTVRSEIQEWEIWTEGNIIHEQYGLQNGKKQHITDTIKEGKNIGRANETTPEEQAELEAQAKWTKKREKEYREAIEELSGQEKTSSFGGYLPMLAHKYKEHGHKIKWPCYLQKKLDGCFFRTTQIITSVGIKTIEDIVDNKLPVDALSYNFKTKKLEFKPIINWFNNGKLNYKEWIEINPKYGKFIKCTKNHLFYTKTGWKSAEELDEKKDCILNANCNEYRNQLIAGTLLGDSCVALEKRGTKTSYRIVFNHTNVDYFRFKIKSLNLEGKITKVKTGYGSNALSFFSKALTQTDFPIEEFFYIGNKKPIGKRRLLNYKTLLKYITIEALSLWIADDGNITFNNKNKYTPRLSIATHMFSNKQIKHILKYFKIKWDCVPSIYHDRRVKSYGRFLTFSTKDTLFILNQLKDYKCKGVEYKYYFSTGEYLKPADFDYKYTTFKKRKSHRISSKITKYDIEVADNHNYFANGILVHNCRSIAIKENNQVTLWFRSGKQVKTMKHIEDALNNVMQNGEIWDGELYIHNEDFNKLGGSIRKDVNLDFETAKKVEYHIYDFPRIKTGENLLVEHHPYKYRLDAFNNRKIEHPLVAVKTTMIREEYEMKELFSKYIEQGYEGVMVRNVGMPYEQRRSYDLLKYKEFDDAEFLVVGYEEGRGQLAGAVGSFICQLPYGQTFKAKLKGKDVTNLLVQYFKNPKLFMGKQLTVQYQGLSKDGIPRFPVGVGLRMDK